MNDIKHACERCHELLTPDGTTWHKCGRTPQGTLPASQPHAITWCCDWHRAQQREETMNHEQALAAVERGSHVTARDIQGGIHCVGAVVGYSITPQVLIITATGQRVWWRADMTDLRDDRDAEPNAFLQAIRED